MVRFWRACGYVALRAVLSDGNQILTFIVCKDASFLPCLGKRVFLEWTLTFSETLRRCGKDVYMHSAHAVTLS